ncbi:MAG: hypothetical protein LBU14_01905 [Candidatus Peribacteria bacterium]|nr:hypothetical protein [Candidatus Peribacteria bacterium]
MKLYYSFSAALIISFNKLSISSDNTCCSSRLQVATTSILICSFSPVAVPTTISSLTFTLTVPVLVVSSTFFVTQQEARRNNKDKRVIIFFISL